ncbi:MAG: thioredoxin family protein [Polyangiaceae bacterium]|jgi:thioredoxin-like negative regulator of GroEL|nr:thioredoxin family protein [Polyangiaceae bacterium]
MTIRPSFASLFALALVATLLGACSSATAPLPPFRSPSKTVGASAGAASQAPAFIENDFPKALAEAKRRGVPVIVDAWAPWCHTCLSLRANVLHHEAMAPYADRFVWASVDTERDESAAFLEKYPVTVWPTLWFLRPDGEPVARWLGALTTDELGTLLGEVEVASKGGGGGGEAAAALVRGDQRAAAGASGEALSAYEEARKKAPAGWPMRGRLIDAYTSTLRVVGRGDECLNVASEELRQLPPGTARSNVAATALLCGEGLARGDANDAKLETIAREAEAIAGDRSQRLLDDDRSTLYESVVSFRKERGDAAGARRVANVWAAFLEGAATAAQTAEQRAVFDAHRLLAREALGQVEQILPTLEASEREAPGDYARSARLALGYHLAHREVEASAAVERALAKAYGPRKLRILSLKADVLEARGDREGARAALEEALHYGETLKLTGGYAKLRDALKKRVAAGPTTPTASK